MLLNSFIYIWFPGRMRSSNISFIKGLINLSYSNTCIKFSGGFFVVVNYTILYSTDELCSENLFSFLGDDLFLKNAEQNELHS